MSDIKFECPKCQRPMVGDEALIDQVVTCPDCQHYFLPRGDKDAVANAKAAAEKFSNENALAILRQKKVEALQAEAGFFCRVGGIFCVVGLLALIIGLFSFMDVNGRPLGCLVFAASAIGAGLWLYFIGQIVHIRANTQK
jgi:hypothetical protein